MIDSDLAHKIVEDLRSKEIRPSDVIEAILLYEHRLDLESKLEKYEELLAEAYQTIVDVCIVSAGDWGVCLSCKEGDWASPSKHGEGCIVDKAQSWLEENR